jgi:hypothetical protein
LGGIQNVLDHVEAASMSVCAAGIRLFGSHHLPGMREQLNVL